MNPELSNPEKFVGTLCLRKFESDKTFSEISSKLGMCPCTIFAGITEALTM